MEEDEKDGEEVTNDKVISDNKECQYMKCSNCGYEFKDGTKCPECGYENNGNVSQENKVLSEKGLYHIKSSYPMKWYRALLVILWLSIVANVASSILFFSGEVYSGYADKVYELFPSLKGIDIFCGIYGIALSLFIFITWLGLLKYKKYAPKFLLSVYILDIVFYIVYLIVVCAITGSAVSSFSSDIGSVTGSVIMLAINAKYFEKRKNLFIN